MMTRRLCAVFTALSALTSLQRGIAAADVPLPARTRAAIVSAVERERRLYGGRTPVPGVLVAVWDGHNRSYVHGFGFADVQRRVALSRDDHFRIGSNTKTFVVEVLLQLVGERKLRLDDPLSRFNLGVTIPNGRNITVRELCLMRSGLFEAYDTPQVNRMHITGSTRFDTRTLVRWAVRQKPYFAPGTQYRYTNTNYLILGLIIEALTHDSYVHQVETRLLDRLGLHQTVVPTTMAMPTPWARGYGLDKNRNWVDVSDTIPVSLMWSAGDMISDIYDMKRWIQAYVTTGTGITPALQRAKRACRWTGEGNLYFGLALGCSVGWYGYTGGLPGYNTANYYMPATGTTIIAWVDLQRSKPSPGVANAIFRDIARIMTPHNVPFAMTRSGNGRSGL